MLTSRQLEIGSVCWTCLLLRHVGLVHMAYKQEKMAFHAYPQDYSPTLPSIRVLDSDIYQRRYICSLPEAYSAAKSIPGIEIRNNQTPTLPPLRHLPLTNPYHVANKVNEYTYGRSTLVSSGNGSTSSLYLPPHGYFKREETQRFGSRLGCTWTEKYDQRKKKTHQRLG